MEFLAAYNEVETEPASSSSETGAPSNSGEPVTTSDLSINPTPEVQSAIDTRLTPYVPPSAREVAFNPSYEAMWAPVQGPVHILEKDKIPGLSEYKNLPTGFVQELHMNDAEFDHQYNNGSQSLTTAGTQSALTSKKRKRDEAKEQRFAANWNNPASENFKGPWANYRNALTLFTEKSAAMLEGEEEEEAEAPQPASEGEEISAEGEQAVKRARRHIEPESTILHIKQLYDSLGRSYMHPPGELKPQPLGEEHSTCYIPKKQIHTWTGHTRGVSAIRFFPRYGHLLLSAGMDGEIRLWDVMGDRQCLRSYLGHGRAVRDVCFNNDGSRFLSAGYDRYVRLWNTETGQCIGRWTNGKTPYVVKFNPDPEKQNEFLVGCADRKILQYDVGKGDQVVQEYDQHLGAVNTITFIDENRRFVTSSDDKSLRVWEYGIPVVIKYISEPHMHSMPSICLHPSGKWFLAQSLDNQILVYSTEDRFRLNKRKRFAGHIVAGYACQVNMSPDGRFVMSGSAQGNVWFWDWQTGRIFRKLKCHDGVAIGCEWHPIETSKVATCGWDGTIKYWD